MANLTGNSGSVTVGGTALGSVLSFATTETGDQVEKTVIGDTWRSHLDTLKSWSGTVTLYFDSSDSTQALLVPNALVVVEFFPEGELSGSYSATGSAFIATVDIANEIEAVVTYDVTIVGDGELVRSTVT